MALRFLAFINNADGTREPDHIGEAMLDGGAGERGGGIGRNGVEVRDACKQRGIAGRRVDGRKEAREVARVAENPEYVFALTR